MKVMSGVDGLSNSKDKDTLQRPFKLFPDKYDEIAA
jgi:hypothetical protein